MCNNRSMAERLYETSAHTYILETLAPSVNIIFNMRSYPILRQKLTSRECSIRIILSKMRKSIYNELKSLYHTVLDHYGHILVNGRSDTKIM